MKKLKSLYYWFIGNEKPFTCLTVANIGIFGHFTMPFIFMGAPLHWVFGGMLIGAILGFIIGLIPYFLALGLIRVGLVSPDF